METEELKEIAKTIYEEGECEIKGRLTTQDIFKLKVYYDNLRFCGDMDD